MSIEVVHVKKVKDWGKPGDVYIGRPGPFGNPFIIGKDGDRRQVIEKYARLLKLRPSLVRQLRNRNPQRLGCWCAPAPCHGHVLLRALENDSA